MVSLYFSLLFLIRISTALFPNHIDFQKIGEVTLNNEKYNVLKPTIHKVTDHFKDFMLRRGSNDNEKVFLDDNGFRHIWKGFDESFRKANPKTDDKKVEPTHSTKTEDTQSLAKTEDTKSLVKTEDIKTALRTNDTSSPAKKEDATITAKTEDNKQPAGGRTMAKVSFFCPFFGVLNMNAFID